MKLSKSQVFTRENSPFTHSRVKSIDDVEIQHPNTTLKKTLTTNLDLTQTFARSRPQSTDRKRLEHTEIFFDGKNARKLNIFNRGVTYSESVIRFPEYEKPRILHAKTYQFLKEQVRPHSSCTRQLFQESFQIRQYCLETVKKSLLVKDHERIIQKFSAFNSLKSNLEYNNELAWKSPDINVLKTSGGSPFMNVQRLFSPLKEYLEKQETVVGAFLSEQTELKLSDIQESFNSLSSLVREMILELSDLDHCLATGLNAIFLNILIIIEKIYLQEKLKWDSIIDQRCTTEKQRLEQETTKIAAMKQEILLQQNEVTSLLEKNNDQIRRLQYEKECLVEEINMLKGKIERSKSSSNTEDVFKRLNQNLLIMKNSLESLDSEAQTKSVIYSRGIKDVVKLSAGYKDPNLKKSKKSEIEKDIEALEEISKTFNLAKAPYDELEAKLMTFHPFSFLLIPQINEISYQSTFGKMKPEQIGEILESLMRELDFYYQESSQPSRHITFPAKLCEYLYKNNDNLMLSAIKLTEICGFLRLSRDNGNTFADFFCRICGIHKSNLVSCFALRHAVRFRSELKKLSSNKGIVIDDSEYVRFSELEGALKKIFTGEQRIFLDISEKMREKHEKYKLIQKAKCKRKRLDTEAQMKKDITMPLVSLIMEKLKIMDVYESLDKLEQIFQTNDTEMEGKIKMGEFKKFFHHLNISINMHDELTKGLLTSALSETKEYVFYSKFVDNMLDSFVDDKFNERKVPLNLFLIYFMDCIESHERAFQAEAKTYLEEALLSGKISTLDHFSDYFALKNDYLRIPLKTLKIYQYLIGAVDYASLFDSIKREKEPEIIPRFDYSKVFSSERIRFQLSSLIEMSEKFLSNNLDQSNAKILTSRSGGKANSPKSPRSPRRKMNTISVRPSKKSSKFLSGSNILGFNQIKKKSEILEIERK